MKGARPSIACVSDWPTPSTQLPATHEQHLAPAWSQSTAVHFLRSVSYLSSFSPMKQQLNVFCNRGEREVKRKWWSNNVSSTSPGGASCRPDHHGFYFATSAISMSITDDPLYTGTTQAMISLPTSNFVLSDGTLYWGTLDRRQAATWCHFSLLFLFSSTTVRCKWYR
jgi:hypothetical protein